MYRFLHMVFLVFMIVLSFFRLPGLKVGRILVVEFEFDSGGLLGGSTL